VNRFSAALLFALLTSAPLFAAQNSPAPKVIPSAPIKDFRLPTFDKDGKRATFMRAGEALFITPTQIDVKDMHFTLFTKDGTGAFDTVLLAPSASFLTDKQVVNGKESVRLIRINLEVTGEQWSYNHLEKRIVIGKKARVTFQDELKDIIK
jgi:hypothetical protein